MANKAAKNFCEVGIHTLIQKWNITVEKKGDYVEN